MSNFLLAIEFLLACLSFAALLLALGLRRQRRSAVILLSWAGPCFR